jgi:hypothetical protein
MLFTSSFGGVARRNESVPFLTKVILFILPRYLSISLIGKVYVEFNVVLELVIESMYNEIALATTVELVELLSNILTASAYMKTHREK